MLKKLRPSFRGRPGLLEALADRHARRTAALLDRQLAAALDGYGPGSGDSETRWDLAWVQNAKGNLCHGGDFLRQLAQYYSKALLLLAPPSKGEEEE